MKNNWLKIILTASLALNLAFACVLGYQYFNSGDTGTPRQSSPGEKAKRACHLDLKAEQKTEIDKIIKTFRIQMMELKQKILGKRIDIIDELGDPDFDPKRIIARVGELNQIENQLNLDFVHALVQVSHILNSKQRLDFLYKLSQNWFFLRHRDREPDHPGKEK